VSGEPIETLSGEIELDLPEFDAPPADPLQLLERWLALADEHGVREARALSLATVAPDGKPSSRIVLVKQVNPALVFNSHRDSRKGRHLAENPWAAGTLYWRETMQQVCVEGRIEPMSEAESDALFAERVRAAQAASIASKQSEELIDPEHLRATAAELADGDTPLGRPDGWSGYRLVPERIEFWAGSTDRLHRRLLFTRTGKAWESVRLQP
jgi:dihydrophenazinedicarboxylate synthase